MGGKQSKNAPQKKIFNFYYDLYCQKLTVYEGTPANEIITTLRDLLQIPSESKLEFLDEDGFPIVISSALPNDIKIHVKIKKTFTEKFIESQNNNNKSNNNNQNSIDWFWLESQRPNSHKRKNNNKTIYQSYNEAIARCKGSLIIDSGEWYYTLLFEPLQCCVFASVCNAEDENIYNYRTDEEDVDNKIDLVDFWRLWPDYENPHTKFPGPVIEAGFYVNMDKKLVVIYDAKLKKENKRFNFNEKWKKISPIVFFKHVVSITVSSNAVKGKPDFIKI